MKLKKEIGLLLQWYKEIENCLRGVMDVRYVVMESVKDNPYKEFPGWCADDFIRHVKGHDIGIFHEVMDMLSLVTSKIYPELSNSIELCDYNEALMYACYGHRIKEQYESYRHLVSLEKNKYPFQAAVDLVALRFLPVNDCGKWKLFTWEGELVFEIDETFLPFYGKEIPAEKNTTITFSYFCRRCNKRREITKEANAYVERGGVDILCYGEETLGFCCVEPKNPNRNKLGSCVKEYCMDWINLPGLKKRKK